jgi:hypothetical protein
MDDRLRLAALLVATVGSVVAAIALGVPLVVGMVVLPVLVTYSGRAHKALDDRRQLGDRGPNDH